MSMIVNNSIAYLDSLQFLKASLHTLAGNLQENDFNTYYLNFQKIN